MFGYIRPVRPEMKVKEFEAYRAVYCGLCQELKRSYGFWPRMMLNYDLVLVALLADGIQGTSGTVCRQRCIANPVQSRCMQQHSGGLGLAAASLVLLGWYKLEDDRKDEGWTKRWMAVLAQQVIKKAYRTAAKQYPQLDAVLSQQTQNQQVLEAAGTAHPDAAAEPTGCMTAEILANCSEKQDQQQILRRMGLCLGKLLYWLDAAEDFDKDLEQGRYNVYLAMGLNREQAIQRAQQDCRLAAAEIARCYHLLELPLNRPILDNILFLGLRASIARAGQPTQKGNKAESL
ncbi:MAG: hypothetical protein H9882_05355 [Candidatus Fournierella pullistercoris]|uniref:Uncharacterized protein n=1 Tax=Candidatus Allofournierella pullistercoris TaxID=2838597 RepID=A0A948WQ42_9FIRM|nr:hypothetical protein [Candidatus Fournierella pullistercoris]